MEIQCVGFHHQHNDDFLIDRPYGIADYLFLLVKTPAIFRIDGKEIITQKNSFILYTKGYSQYYRAFGKNYIDDWMHFRGEDMDELLIKTLDIPTNTVVPLGSISEISGIMRSITTEFYSDNPYRADITESYMRILFMKLSDILRLSRESKSDGELIKYTELRNAIFQMPHIKRSVDDMARELTVSRSGFQHSYKRYFGVSVSEDKINARVQRAEFYLSSTELSLAEISDLCGYKDEAYFMKQFKRIKGLTPTEFRNELKTVKGKII